MKRIETVDNYKLQISLLKLMLDTYETEAAKSLLLMFEEKLAAALDQK